MKSDNRWKESYIRPRTLISIKVPINYLIIRIMFQSNDSSVVDSI